MTDLRRIDRQIDMVSYPVIEELLTQEVSRGAAPSTLMVWSYQQSLGLILGPLDDGDQVDLEKARQLGTQTGRRYLMQGGAGFFKGGNTPTVYVVAKDDGRSLQELVDGSGEAAAAALRSAGFPDAIYCPFGNLELRSDEPGVPGPKIGANGAAFRHGAWAVFVNFIDRLFSPGEFGLISSILRLPKEKFDDKSVKTVAGRMLALSQSGVSYDPQAILEGYVTELAKFVGMSQAVPADWSAAEVDQMERRRAYFGSADWINLYSSRALVARVPANTRIAEVAYKSTKLIKVTFGVDPDGRISDALYTGDMYIRPAPEGLRQITDAIVGQRVDDDDGLLSAVGRVFEQPGFEAPYLKPEDFVAPVKRGRERLQSPAEYLAAASA